MCFSFLKLLCGKHDQFIEIMCCTFTEMTKIWIRFGLHVRKTHLNHDCSYKKIGHVGLWSISGHHTTMQKVSKVNNTDHLNI